jgi:hypothetical protein
VLTKGILERIDNLISRAIHPTTPIEEARTSAFIAVKMISEHGLFDPRPPPPPPPERKMRITTKHGGFCRVCRRWCEVNSLVWWARGDGITHIACGGDF